ncbi:hypothetical protein DW1_1238 [Proteiniborus sp. DW1]|uniref:YtxH domain-containing protein n=1 Tax=Proteiniborus sp. DW1 TaxID=1889883 RepID=UPI00092DFE29|nr:YtxH domain-containing protein [Proteiniborus sp. DW1]SCG82811.1 hypothetical protein DW1_1238 [Proteiniborus sp. DW1]
MPVRHLFEKSKKEKEKKMRKEIAKKVAVGTAVGTALGAVTGVLFAPKSGKETREDIAKKTKEATEAVKVTLKDSGQVLMEKGEIIGRSIKEKIEEVKIKKDSCQLCEEELQDYIIIEEDCEEEKEENN